MPRLVEVEINKNEIFVLEEDKAIELCTVEYFNGKTPKLNGIVFDILNFGKKLLA